MKPSNTTPYTRSRAALPDNVRATLEASNLTIEVATAIADRIDQIERELAVVQLLRAAQERTIARLEGLRADAERRVTELKTARSAIERNQIIEECAKVAEAHKGQAARERRAKKFLLNDEIQAEERGEDIASEIIARDIRALIDCTGSTTQPCSAFPRSYGGGASCEQRWTCDECGDVTDLDRCPKNRLHR